MLSRERNYQSIAWVRDQNKLGNLDLDPPYQRKSVWSRGFQQFFIDSILRNYPVPAIFIAEEIKEDGTGRVIHHVIDGKQRLTAILEFLDDTYPIGKDSEPDVRKKYYSELDTRIQSRFLSYRLPFEIFNMGDTDAITIQDVYERFNRNVSRLNDQELRKAKFQGEFSQKIEYLTDQLSEDPDWTAIKLFTKNAIRRMQDIEYVAELYILTKDGIQEPDVIDEYYAKYDDDLPDHSATIATFMSINTTIAKLKLDYSTTRYSNLNDFYSLWAAIRKAVVEKKHLNYSKTNRALTKFSADVEAAVPNNQSDNKPPQIAFDYSDVVRQGANKKANRQKRSDILYDLFVYTK